MPARNILSLANKVALITGAAAPLGIGRATAALFAENGARVVVTDLVSQRTRGMETVADIRREGGTAIFVPLDVSNEQDWIAAIEETEETYGPLDILFNNAGHYPEMNFDGHLSEHPTRLFDLTMEVNTKGLYLGMKYGAGSMAKRKRRVGSLINTSSVAGLTGSMGGFAYTMSKHAVTGATKWAAQALAPDIRVNSIHPGSIETNLQDPLLDKSPEESAKARAMIAGWHPMKRIAKPAEVANVALFLASDASSFMTGSMVTVDGGILSVNGLG